MDTATLYITTLVHPFLTLVSSPSSSSFSAISSGLGPLSPDGSILGSDHQTNMGKDYFEVAGRQFPAVTWYKDPALRKTYIILMFVVLTSATNG